MPPLKCISPHKSAPCLKNFEPDDFFKMIEQNRRLLTSSLNGDLVGLYRCLARDSMFLLVIIVLCKTWVNYCRLYASFFVSISCVRLTRNCCLFPVSAHVSVLAASLLPLQLFGTRFLWPFAVVSPLTVFGANSKLFSIT